MQTVTPVPHAENNVLGKTIDEIYSETIEGQTLIRGYLIHKKGNPGELFFAFYYPFTSLYQHTRCLREMKDVSPALMKDIGHWIETDHRVSPSLMRIGSDLFSEYQLELVEKGVVVLKRT